MIGRYNGIDYRQQRHCDVFPTSPLRGYWWFLYGDDGCPTGDCYRTKQAMVAAIDSGRVADESDLISYPSPI